MKRLQDAIQRAKRILEKEVPEGEVVSTLIDGEEYFIQAMDSTHVRMSFDKDKLDKGLPLHVGQMPSRKLSADVYKWLGGAGTIDKSYKRD